MYIITCEKNEIKNKLNKLNLKMVGVLDKLYPILNFIFLIIK